MLANVTSNHSESFGLSLQYLDLMCGKPKGTGHVIKSAHSLEASYFRSGLGTVWLRCHEKFSACESFSSFLLFHLKIQSIVTV